MTDTATITLPSRFLNPAGKFVSIYDGQNTISTGQNRFFSLGDQVTIRLSYVGQHNDELKDSNAVVFKGFIREINNKAPLQIICDDYMYLLKKSRANVSLPNDSTISTIVDTLLTKAGWINVGPGENGSIKYDNDISNIEEADSIQVKYIDPDIKYGKLMVKDKPSVTAVLTKLKFFKFFFKTNVGTIPTLYVALPQTTSIDEREEHSIEYESRIIEDNLYYQTDEDVLFRVTAKSFVDNNKYREVTVGDPDGELRTIHAPSGLNEEELRIFAQEELEKLRFTGFKASFLTFGDPIIRHLDIVEITRSKQPEQGVGRFIVDKVVTEFGFSGFRQEVYLGSKA